MNFDNYFIFKIVVDVVLILQLKVLKFSMFASSIHRKKTEKQLIHRGKEGL